MCTSIFPASLVTVTQLLLTTGDHYWSNSSMPPEGSQRPLKPLGTYQPVLLWAIHKLDAKRERFFHLKQRQPPPLNTPSCHSWPWPFDEESESQAHLLQINMQNCLFMLTTASTVQGEVPQLFGLANLHVMSLLVVSAAETVVFSKGKHEKDIGELQAFHWCPPCTWERYQAAVKHHSDRKTATQTGKLTFAWNTLKLLSLGAGEAKGCTVLSMVGASSLITSCQSLKQPKEKPRQGPNWCDY